MCVCVCVRVRVRARHVQSIWEAAGYLEHISPRERQLQRQLVHSIPFLADGKVELCPCKAELPEVSVDAHTSGECVRA
jgi:hypothetical protein